MHSKFSIQWIDPDTGYVVFEIYLDDTARVILSASIEQTIRELGPGSFTMLEPNTVSDINLARDAIARWPALPIRVMHNVSELPYRTHGGREFDLMMKEKKPLAAFSYVEKGSTLDRFLKRYFAPEVTQGRFVEGRILDTDASDSDAPLKILYALSSESWRIEAYRMMFEAAKISRWNDALEFIEGSLLGYSPEESQFWFSFRKTKGLRWGSLSFYRMISFEEMRQLEINGMKAFGPTSADEIVFYSPDRNRSEADSIKSLRTLKSFAIAKFYANVRFIGRFYREKVDIDNVDLGMFSIQSDESNMLNELIDGKIEILERL
jgi:hypothetical protein